MTSLETLLRSGRHVFTTDDLRIYWQESDAINVKARAKYYYDQGSLKRIHHGVYALSDDYDPLEVANKLIVTSYISLETALLAHGVIFQFTNQITSCASYNRSYTIGDQSYVYHQMSRQVLLNPTGIAQNNNYSIASIERAICDWIYYNRRPIFDNTRDVDKIKLLNLAPHYQHKSVIKRINKFSQQL